MTSINQLLQQTIENLNTVSDSARLDTELLLCAAVKKQRTFLHAWPEHELTQEQLSAFQHLLEQRLLGKPIAHIIGERGFWSLNLRVTPDTLIPRPDTERLVEIALEHINKKVPLNILDLGTGTGAIALSLAKECPTCFVTATDQSISALEVANQNAIDNEIDNVTFLQSDWFSNLGDDKFNLIVSNPPYIKEDDPHLSQGDVRFEPLSALTAGADGLDDIRIIIKNSKRYLCDNGVLLIEHGYDQAHEVCELLKAENFNNVKNYLDYNNNPRVSAGIK